jgi:hypothetical protein
VPPADIQRVEPAGATVPPQRHRGKAALVDKFIQSERGFRIGYACMVIHAASWRVNRGADAAVFVTSRRVVAPYRTEANGESGASLTSLLRRLSLRRLRAGRATPLDSDVDMFFPFAAARCVKKPKQMFNIRGIPRIWKNGARTLGAKFEEFLENGGSPQI